MFRDERPIKLSSTRFKQELERRANSGLMRDTESSVSIECGVVVSNRFVCGFESEGRHCGFRERFPFLSPFEIES